MGSDHEQRRGLELPGDEIEHLKGARLGSMKVLEDHDERLAFSSQEQDS